MYNLMNIGLLPHRLSINFHFDYEIGTISYKVRSINTDCARCLPVVVDIHCVVLFFGSTINFFCPQLYIIDEFNLGLLDHKRPSHFTPSTLPAENATREKVDKKKLVYLGANKILIYDVRHLTHIKTVNVNKIETNIVN